MNKLSPAEQKFILHWGEMGTRWGINRSVAQVHALLFISDRPLHAEEIADTLGMARSNVSTSIKELQNWGIVKMIHLLGDKRDHFESLKDVWEMFRVITEERKKREFDPTLQMLKDCLAEAEQEKPVNKTTQTKLRSLLEFFETTGRWYHQMQQLPQSAVQKIAQMGDKFIKLFR